MARRLRLKLTSPQEVRHALTRVANLVLNGEIEPKTSNAIVIACNSILSSIRIDEQQKKLDELEAVLGGEIEDLDETDA